MDLDHNNDVNDSAFDQDTPPFDVEKAMNRCMQDAEFFCMVLNSFVEDMPECIAKLEAAIEASDLNAAAQHTHAIKGSVGLVAGEDISQMAQEAERLCLEGELEDAKRQITKLRRELDRCISFASRIRHDLPSSSS